MRVLQCSAWYRPYDTGGTEVYLEGLVAELGRLGVENTVVTPRPRAAPTAYVHAGAPVETYPVNDAPFPGEMKSGAPHLGFEDFLEVLARHRGAVYHQHSWTRGCGPRHLRAAHEAGFRTVLTVHVAGNICLRGTMLRFGAEPCNGKIEPVTCGACWAAGRGLPQAAARLLAHTPASIARRTLTVEGRLASALSARALAERTARQLGRMSDDADRIVAVCQWVYDALALNGVPRCKLALSRQGVSRDLVERPATVPRPGPLRLALLARWDPVKGVETAVRAVRALPAEAPVELRVYAISAPGPGADYERRVRALAAGDGRIRFEPPAPRDRVGDVLADADALLVPSIWLETGPLTVLEAQAAGLFVLGSRRGGIAELVDETQAGELVEAEDVAAWATAIAQLCDRKAQGQLPRHTQPVRTMADAARDMIELYRSL